MLREALVYPSFKRSSIYTHYISHAIQKSTSTYSQQSAICPVLYLTLCDLDFSLPLPLILCLL